MKHMFEDAAVTWFAIVYDIKMHLEGKKSHRCEKGGALTHSKDESRRKILCFRVQVHFRPRTNLAIWLGDKNTVKQPHYK